MLPYLIPRPRVIDVKKGYYPVSPLMKKLMADPIVNEDYPFIRFLTDQSLSDGEYHLDVNEESIQIKASCGGAHFPGILTLSQILKNHPENIPCCSIKDKAAFKQRAVMLDISRNRIYKMDRLKEMIRFFSILKYNELQLYMENTFAYEGHETVWKDASAYSAQEVRELDEYCRERGIELVPNQNSFGHMERWLKHKEYFHLAEVPEGFKDPWGVYRPESSTLSPAVPETMDFLNALYDQLLPCFSSRQFNIGCDETFDLGLGKSKERVEKEGSAQVYRDFLFKLCREVQDRGYKVQFWADIILASPDLVKELPRDIVAMNWGYESDHPFEKESTILRDAGIPFYICAGTSSWNALSGRWDNAYQNIKEGSHWAHKNGAIGFMLTDWGDNGHFQPPVASWPGFVMGAQAAWGGSESMPHEDDPFWTKILSRHIYRDPGGKLAEAHRKMALLWRENPIRLHNGSIFSYLMMDPFYPYYRDRYNDCRQAGIGKAVEVLMDCQNLIDNAEPENDYFQREGHMMLSLWKYAVLLCEKLFPYEQCSCTGLNTTDKDEILTCIEGIEKEFRAVWYMSSRPGGLEDSLEKLSSWKTRLK